MASDLRPIGRARSYRQRAHDCIQLAITAADVETRAALLDLAFGWTRMAKQIERLKLEPDDVADMFRGVQVLIMTSMLRH
jgi:hypothetical protein